MSWVSGLYSLFGIALDATHAYVTEVGGGNINKILLSDGSVTKFWVTGLNGPRGIALDTTHAYVTNYNNNSISKILLSDGSVVPWVTTGLFYPYGIALDATHAYVTNFNNSISKILLSNGNVVLPWVTTGLNNPRDIALDTSYAYVTNGSNNSISKILLSNGSVIPWVTTGLSDPRGIALNSNYVYVNNFGSNSINRYFIYVPTNVVATPSVNSVILNWVPVSGATSYNILYGTTTSYGNTKTVSTNSGTVIRLTPGIIYNFAIQAVKGSTISSNSSNVTSIPNSSTPTNVVATPGVNSVILNWVPVSGATSYNVLYGNTTSYGNTKIVSTNSGTVIRLTPGIIYNFAVQAVNGSTISSNSSNVTSIPNYSPNLRVLKLPPFTKLLINSNETINNCY
jgi:hypothetical protein